MLYVFILYYFVLVFFSPFSIAITSLGKERANLSVFRTFVRFVLVWFYRFPLPLGVLKGLRFVIVALPGLFSYLFLALCYFVLEFVSPFSIAITSLGEEICACLVLSVSSSSSCLGWAVACDCGTPWTSLLLFLFINTSFQNLSLIAPFSNISLYDFQFMRSVVYMTLASLESANQDACFEYAYLCCIWVFSKKKELDPFGCKFLTFRVNIFSLGALLQYSKKGNI